MVNYKLLEQEIKQNKNLDINLPHFMNAMSSIYFSYSSTNFAMLYYDFYENIVDKNYDISDKERLLISNLNEIVKNSLLSEFDGKMREKSIKKISGIRKEIMKRMQILTAYADLFTLYEYVLNRMELRYEEDIKDIDNDTSARKILQFIFAQKDNVVVNDRIRLMVSQMPIRMTKNKFFDILKNGLSIYEGADSESLNDFLYRIRSSAGIFEPEGMETEYPYLSDCKKIFTELDTGSIDEEGFGQLNQKLKESASYLISLTDCYYAMQQLVNHLYTILLNYPYTSLDVICETEKVRKIISNVEQGFSMGSYESIDEETVALFMETEGKLEHDTLELQRMEGLLDVVSADHQKTISALMLNQICECLMLSVKLTSNSLFIELNSETKEGRTKTKNQKIKAAKSLDASEVMEAYNKLYEELSHRLNQQSKMLNRAMIAAVLRELPVFFSNHTEVMDYVKNSLAGCRDLAEKVISVKLLEDSMVEAE